MPFEDDDKEEKKKIGLRNVSTKKSIFDKEIKKPTQNIVDRAYKMEENNSLYKEQVANLASKFLNMINDKTLKQNKEIFKEDLEKEILADMIRLAEKINCDAEQLDSAGSLAWITILLKTVLIQRDKINSLEYNLMLLSNHLKSLKQS